MQLERAQKRERDLEHQSEAKQAALNEEAKRLRLRLRKVEADPKDLDVAQTMGEQFEIYREASIQPGKPVNMWIELLVPMDWSFAQLEELVKKTYPGLEFELKGPQNISIEGKDYVCPVWHSPQERPKEVHQPN